MPPKSVTAAKPHDKPGHLVIYLTVAGSLCFMGFAAFGAFIWVAINPNRGIELPTLFGVLGDFISGSLGPILSLVGIYFVVLAFREQRATTIAERESEATEAFENRYYHLVRIHRENVVEMQLGRGETVKEGRKVFVSILDELQFALRKIREVVGTENSTISPLLQLQIAYYAVFFGINSNSHMSMLEALKPTGCDLTSPEFLQIESELISTSLISTYSYFKGHQSRLGHYYRHLYQTISYVDGQSIEIDKREYAKTVRAQLSTHEQALLLVNSLTPIGWKWWTDGYLINYGMVKNIPNGFLEEFCSFVPSEMFPEKYFEWQESRQEPLELKKFRLIGE